AAQLRTHTVTWSLCTSKPAHRSTSTSIAHLHTIVVGFGRSETKEGVIRARSNNRGHLSTPPSWCDTGSTAPLPLDVPEPHPNFIPAGAGRKAPMIGVTEFPAVGAFDGRTRRRSQ